MSLYTVKFTERGEVRLAARLDTLEASLCRVTFDVVDTGIGLSAEQRQRLFDAFSQADSSTTRRYGGTGLGLVICRRLIALMGGELTLASSPGNGSRFTFVISLPVAQATRHESDDAQAPPPPLRLEGARILLAEDNAINQHLVQRLLEGMGATVTVVEHGGKAIEVVERQAVDLVLMDLQMPVMDGFEASRRIRHRFPGMPIIALSAAVLENERQQALAAGMNDHLAKPIDARKLATSLAYWLERSGSLPTTASASTQAAKGVAHAWLDQLRGFDIQQGLMAAGGDHELYHRVLAMFRQQLEAFRGALQSHSPCQRQDFAQRLHTLKGAAGSLGATRLAQAAERLEALAIQHEPLLPAHVEPFASALQETWQALLALPETVT